MKYSQTIYCSAKEAWDIISKSVAYEIGQAKNTTIAIEDIKEGYTYRKDMQASRGGKMKTEIVITAFDAPKRYSAKVSSKEGVNYMSYCLDEVDDEECIITYEETFQSSKLMTGLNAKLVSFLLSMKQKKTVKNSINYIEKAAIAARKTNN